MSQKRLYPGFTIVELLVVIVVIGLLATIVTVAYNGISERAKLSTRQSDEAQARKQIEAYYALYGSYPVSNTCPTTETNQICLKASPGNTLSYGVNNAANPPTYSVSVSATPTTPSIVTNGLVLHLDAGNTSSYPGTGTVWTDLSGNSLNCNLLNGVGYSSSNNGYLSFDGVNDIVQCPKNAIFFGAAFTFDMFWRKTGNSSNFYHGLVWAEGGTGGGSGGQYLLTYRDAGYWHYRIQNTTTGWGLSEPSASLSASTWYHITWSFNAGASKIYVNGSLAFTDSSRGVYSGGSDSPLFIGGRNDVTHLTNGNIGLVRAYSRMLTDAEVLQNFNANKSRYGI